ncbi:MAG: preprotein translocase subunit YajC [Alphaproteobacteria bacterium]|nr:preprotein translocase subunit YajC [Alphaproteobacteria bacterium]
MADTVKLYINKVIYLGTSLMLFFIGQVFADGNTNTQQSSLLSFLPMVGFIILMYFLLIRPQQKKQKQHQALIASIKKGDKVMTNSGLIATVDSVENEQEVILEIANGVKCRFVKGTIMNIINNNTTNQTTSNTTPQSLENKKG